MKLPRAVGALELIAALRRLGDEVTRQTGSHLRSTCAWPRQHPLILPNHSPLATDTLAAIVAELARGRGEERQTVVSALVGGNGRPSDL